MRGDDEIIDRQGPDHRRPEGQGRGGHESNSAVRLRAGHQCDEFTEGSWCSDNRRPERQQREGAARVGGGGRKGDLSPGGTCGTKEESRAHDLCQVMR